jgi:hypothetical protein
VIFLFFDEVDSFYKRQPIFVTFSCKSFWYDLLHESAKKDKFKEKEQIVVLEMIMNKNK